MNAVREKVRVANALVDLPKIRQSFSSGEISYSKVRAMTRVATAENEDYLLMIAKHTIERSRTNNDRALPAQQLYVSNRLSGVLHPGAGEIRRQYSLDFRRC